jgi:alpha-L-fucosidase 2
MLDPSGAAFICQNIWDHYAYTGDRKFLKTTGWPIMKGAAEFWVKNLQEVEGGYLAVSPSYSPEQGPLTDGAYYPAMIVWDLFDNCIKATELLDEDKEFAKRLKGMRDRIQPLKVGEYGQLQEWRDPNVKYERLSNKSQHRHISHMWAVYPGKQIIPGRDDAFTKAAIQSMNYRGDAATSWSMGWKINVWARLLDGNRAHKLINNFIRSLSNLWHLGQIDGNFGYTAGVAELLLQSHVPTGQYGRLGELHLLPALPDKWPTGSIKGLKARGGVVVDMKWEGKALTDVQVETAHPGTYTFVYRDRKAEVTLEKEKPVSLKGVLIP